MGTPESFNVVVSKSCATSVPPRSHSRDPFRSLWAPSAAVCVTSVGVRGQQLHRLARLSERSLINAGILTLALRTKYKKRAARKDLRPVVEDLAARSIQSGDRRWPSTGSGDLEEAGIPAPIRIRFVAPGNRRGLGRPRR